MRFELSELQLDTLKSTCDLRVHVPQICIVIHDHFTVIPWFGTHIIVHGLKRSNFRKGILKLKIQLLVSWRFLATE
jgi:hypothetical protein